MVSVELIKLGSLWNFLTIPLELWQICNWSMELPSWSILVIADDFPWFFHGFSMVFRLFVALFFMCSPRRQQKQGWMRTLQATCLWLYPKIFRGDPRPTGETRRCCIDCIGLHNDWLVVWNMLYFSHILGRVIPTDFYIFQRGWNHQPDDVVVFLCFLFTWAKKVS